RQTCAADGNSWGPCDDLSMCPRTGCPVDRYQQSGSTGPTERWCGDPQLALAGEVIHLTSDLTGDRGVFAEIIMDGDSTPKVSTPAFHVWAPSNAGTAYYANADFTVPPGGGGMFRGCIRTSGVPVVARITVDVAGVQTPNGAACSTHNERCFGRSGPQC